MTDQMIDHIINFPTDPDRIKDFLHLDRYWENLDNVRIELPKLGKTEIEKYIRFLEKYPTQSLTQVIADALAEYDTLSADDLIKLDAFGDTGVKCTIALRPDVPDFLRKKYLASDDYDVFRAAVFNQQTSHSELESIFHDVDEQKKRIINRRFSLHTRP